MLAELWMLAIVIGFYIAVRKSLDRYSADEFEQAALIPLNDESEPPSDNRLF